MYESSLHFALFGLAKVHECDKFGGCEGAVLFLVEEEEGREGVGHHETGGGDVHEVFEGEIAVAIQV